MHMYETRLPTLPLTMNGKRPQGSAQLPEPGADSSAILAEIGLGPDEIERLLASGAVGTSA